MRIRIILSSLTQLIFAKKTTWTPHPKRDKPLDMFLSYVDSELINEPEEKIVLSLTANERQPLRKHTRNAEVVIREADKLSAVVIMSRECCIAEAYRQLSDTDMYQQVSNDVSSDVIGEIKNILYRPHCSGLITNMWLLMLFI